MNNSGKLTEKVQFLVLLLYTFIFFLFSYPLIFHFSNAIPGSGNDPYQYIWNAYVFRENILNIENPFYTYKFFFPTGVSTLMHTYTPIIGFFNLAFNNPYLSVNIVLLLSFVFSGFGAFLLASKYLNSTVLSFLCGFVFAFSSYKMSHLLEHHHLMLTATVPFYIMVFRDSFNIDGPLKITNYKKLFVCAFLGVLTFFSDYYTTFFLLAFSVFFLFYFGIAPGIKRIKKLWRYMTVIFLLIGIHLLVERLRIENIDDKGGLHNSGDLLGFFIPWENSRFIAFDFFKTLGKSMGISGSSEQVVFPGFSLILLLLIGISLGYKYAKGSMFIKFLGFCSLMFLFLSFPKLKFDNHTILFSPTSFLHFIPGINNIRNPTRFIGMLYLVLPLFGFYCVEKYLESSKFRKLLKFGPWAFAVILFIEYYPKNYPLIKQSDVPSFVFELAKDTTIKQLMSVPSGAIDGFQHSGTFKAVNLQWAIHHRKNLVEGYISRLPEKYFAIYENEKVFKVLNQVYEYGIDSAKVIESNDVNAFLKHFQPQVIVLHPGSKNQFETEKFILKTFGRNTNDVRKEKGYVLYYISDPLY